MNLLPSKDELQPIWEEEGTFSHCLFVKNFNDLAFIEKLQTINDILRQTIKYSSTPNPANDTKNLIGDSLTSAIVSVQYLKSLNIGQNQKIVWLDRKNYDPVDYISERFAVIVEDQNCENYLFDATPQIGYGFGRVKKLKEEKIFTNYKEISLEQLDKLYVLREFLYNTNNEYIADVVKLLNSLSFENNPEYAFWASKCYKTLAFLDKMCYPMYVDKAQSINPYINVEDPKNEWDVAKKNERDSLLFVQIDKWQNEILGLSDDKTDFVYSLSPKKQIKIAQNIYGELIKIDKTVEPRFMIKGEVVSASCITPRFCYDNQLNVIMIKPSSYRIGKQEEITRQILSKADNIVCHYSANLGKEKTLTAIKPLLFSHSVGLCVERPMSGPSDIFLVKGDVDAIKKEKKSLRSKYGDRLYGTEQKWLDGENILWEKWSMNFVHSTDNAVEAGVHFLIDYPEYQIMTRFMYPNPKLMVNNMEKVKEQNIEMEK